MTTRQQTVISHAWNKFAKIRPLQIGPQLAYQLKLVKVATSLWDSPGSAKSNINPKQHI